MRRRDNGSCSFDLNTLHDRVEQAKKARESTANGTSIVACLAMGVRSKRDAKLPVRYSDRGRVAMSPMVLAKTLL
jgi:hypothetical protein